MPTKIVNELLTEVKELKTALTDHLIESSGIKAKLNVNTWLTGVILIALIGKLLVEYFKH